MVIYQQNAYIFFFHQSMLCVLNYAAKKKYLLISDIIKNSDFSIRHHGFLLKGQRDFKLKLLDTPLAVYRKRPAYGFGAFLGSIKADTAHCST